MEPGQNCVLRLSPSASTVRGKAGPSLSRDPARPPGARCPGPRLTGDGETAVTRRHPRLAPCPTRQPLRRHPRASPRTGTPSWRRRARRARRPSSPKRKPSREGRGSRSRTRGRPWPCSRRRCSATPRSGSSSWASRARTARPRPPTSSTPILRAAGRPSGLLGTVQYRIGNRLVEAVRTTPEASDLQHLFREMAEAGCRYAVLEVSSHSLVLKRVHGCAFQVAVFTNLTRDHLDFHGDMESVLRGQAGALRRPPAQGRLRGREHGRSPRGRAGSGRAAAECSPTLSSRRRTSARRRSS